MQLAFAITEYFPFGGAQKDFYAVVNEMAARGHQISIITTGWQGDKNPEWSFYILDHKFSTNHGRMQALSAYVQQLKQQVAFDAVIGFTKMVGLDIYFAADNCFTTTRFHGIRRWLPRYKTYAQIEQNMFANQDLKVLFLTEVQQRQYLQSFDLPTDQQALLPICVDKRFHYQQDRWQAARQWRQAEMSDDRVLLLFVAADFKTKGLDRVINALASLNQAQRSRFSLWIVGDGRVDQYQNSLDKLSGFQYRFWGGQAEMPRFYFAADYLIHPARKEAAGMVLAEAMAAKLPICVTDICGYQFLALDDPKSVVLHEKNVQEELVNYLKDLTQASQIPERGQGSAQVSDASRAEFCANQIEAWCQQ